MQGGGFSLPVDILAAGPGLPGTVVIPRIKAYIQDPAQLLCGERQERLEDYRQVGAYLQRDIQYRGCPVHVGLGDFPRLRVSEILVACTGYVHGFLQGLAELAVLYILLDGLLQCRYLGQCLPVYRLRFEVCRDLPSEILVGQDY